MYKEETHIKKEIYGIERHVLIV